MTKPREPKEAAWIDRLVWERIKELSNLERVRLIQNIAELITKSLDDALQKIVKESP